MNQANSLDIPVNYPALLAKSKEMGFSMSSDMGVGSLLRTLVASKSNGNFLELGTGVGLSLAWMVQGMDKDSHVISVDNEAGLIQIAKAFFQDEPRLELVCADGGEWLESYQGDSFDLIFADAWPGKYSHLENALALLKMGGFYVIDDMSRQPNWPVGHQDKANELIELLEKRKDITITKMDWSTGLIVAVKIK
ncbi:methyltransferase domain-containing protein [Flagellimonas olearia]|uniref:Methyltransferase domain-containing protein n=1 Tax=Flagellimonas olearia TaxID=552546 RepID=A0A6I1E4J3_9FLAO|nr:class I SAM-dependent methyltransferase [Allomuricauda olearia]KAB7530850.1 methyltransferase domain-containing protein [Allomuricauda olearia]